ncbi:MAG: NADH-quinone oxidoreductase subunit M [Planctomycetia bacterium]|nr:NADH-quinone oxidoreductase subunit M [Planctomycetia bacterium]
MPVDPTTLLSLLTFFPAIGALVLAFLPKDKPDALKLFTLVITGVVFAASLGLVLPSTGWYDPSNAGMQLTFAHPWIPTFNIDYAMGLDGISMPLLLLTTFVFFLSMWASWPIEKHVKAYCILFLILETGVIGVFMSLNFFLFYVFWEVMLLPMYFLIGVWGGPRREYAAIKFFIYTLLGGVFMLIAVLMLYFTSDVKALTPAQLQTAHVVDASLTGDDLAAAVNQIQNQPGKAHTFNILALQQLGQFTDQFRSDKPEDLILGKTIEWWAFLLLFAGFVIKVPSVPVHTWLPDAHVEAPTPISMILAGVLLKLGGYGIIRICYPICPEAGYELAWFVCGLGVVSMLYGAFAALAQKDFKRLVAYSSVSHMGYVVLGLGVWSASYKTGFDPQYWAMGMNGAMFQMIAHGIASPGMFFMVGVIYERVHHRNLDEFGGLFAKMPVYSGLAFGIFFAGLGLPGLCGFIGEVFVTLSVWNYSQALAVIGAFTVILTAAYILWTLQRVYLGPEYKGPHGDHLHPMTPRELAIAAPILFLCIFFGVYPNAVFKYMSPSVTKTAVDLAEWTQREDPDKERRESEQQTAAITTPITTSALAPTGQSY